MTAVSYDDFDDLELGEVEAMPANPKPQVASEGDDDEASDDFSELDDLLADAMQERRETQSVIETRKRAKAGFGLSTEDQDRVRRWELAREWLPVANTAVFRRYVCACGFHSTVFEGLFLEQRHRHSSHANRWTAAEASQANLPNDTAIRVKSIPMCQRCAESKGFSLKTDIIWEA